MRKKAHHRNRPKRLDYSVDLPFAASVRQLAPRHRDPPTKGGGLYPHSRKADGQRPAQARLQKALNAGRRVFNWSHPTMN